MVIIDPERQLALSYVGGQGKARLNTLWRLDFHFAQLVGASSQPVTVQLKLAWWREALIALDSGPAPAEPLLQEVKDQLLPAGLSGGGLATLADGWEYLVAAELLSHADLKAYAVSRGGTLFRLSARLLGEESEAWQEQAGSGWALVDLARHSSRSEEAQAALETAAALFAGMARPWPWRLRPLGMLAILARHDADLGVEALEAPASPRRILRMLVHRLTGR